MGSVRVYFAYEGGRGLIKELVTLAYLTIIVCSMELHLRIWRGGCCHLTIIEYNTKQCKSMNICTIKPTHWTAER